MGNVFLRCDFCGNAKITKAQEGDPIDTVFITTSECDLCCAANFNGGFSETQFYDKHGKNLYEEI